MIYLTAQPGAVYFFWQLELQLRNLNKIGVRPESIHTLIAYDSDDYAAQELKKFLECNSHLAKIFVYPDRRTEKSYTSSIRPHIIKQHFEKHKFLEKETIVYIDSDVVFERMIDDSLFNGEINYVSDTRNYLNADYIINYGSKELLTEMSSIVGISVEKVIQENDNTGGAQYILKNVPSSFWKKVERDSTDLYLCMEKYNKKLWEASYLINRDYKSRDLGIQSWCADMWAVLWNLWKENRDVLIHKELDFLWPDHPIDEWGEKIILHYTGITDVNFNVFTKTRYLHYAPWYDDRLSKIPTSSCSRVLYDLISERRKEIDDERVIMTDFIFIFECETLDENILERFKIIKKYYQKYIDVRVYLYFEKSLLSSELLGESGRDFILTSLTEFSEQNNDYAILILPTGTIIDVNEIINIKPSSNNNKQCIIEFEKTYKLDYIVFGSFITYLDIQTLSSNKGKFDKISHPHTMKLLLCDTGYLSAMKSLKFDTKDLDLACKVTIENSYHVE